MGYDACPFRHLLIKRIGVRFCGSISVEHVFGTLKHWMGAAHFLTRTLGRVSTEMSLQVLAYNLKRVIKILGVARAIKAMKMVGA
jgi:hypothetical protein